VHPARSLPAGLVTGVGSLPGREPAAALALVARWAPELPFWPQLPARSDLVDELLGGAPGLRREAGGPARVSDRAALLEHLRRAPLAPPPAGLGALLEAVRRGDFPRARALKGQLAGPVTLAAALAVAPEDAELRAALATRVAREAAAQAEALCAAGLPALVWLDEPALGTDLAGAPALLRPALAAIGAAGAATGLHTCAPPPWSLLLGLAPDVVSFDAWRDLEQAAGDPACRELLARGTRLAVGLVPTVGPPPGDLRAGELFRRLWLALRRLGDPPRLAARLLVTASCGLGLRPPGEVGPSFALARDLGTWVAALATRTVDPTAVDSPRVTT
jgi:hypothetical protein